MEASKIPALDAATTTGGKEMWRAGHVIAIRSHQRRNEVGRGVVAAQYRSVKQSLTLSTIIRQNYFLKWQLTISCDDTIVEKRSEWFLRTLLPQISFDNPLLNQRIVVSMLDSLHTTACFSVDVNAV